MLSGHLGVARRMYAWRLGEVLREHDITILHGVLVAAPPAWGWTRQSGILVLHA